MTACVLGAVPVDPRVRERQSKPVRRLIPLFCLVACQSPATPVPTLVPISAPTVASVPSKSASNPRVVDVLTDAVRAYIDQGNPRPLFGLYAQELVVRAGRSRTHSPDDAIFGHTRIEAIYTYATRHEPTVTARMTDVVVEEKGETTAIEWVLHLAGATPSAFGERYELVKRTDGFRIVQFAYWPLRPESATELGKSYYADLDVRLDRARAAKDDRMVAYLLMSAWRFDECAKLARVLTEKTPAEPWVWTMRAKASALVGDLEDADLAATEAERLKSP